MCCWILFLITAAIWFKTLMLLVTVHPQQVFVCCIKSPVICHWLSWGIINSWSILSCGLKKWMWYWTKPFVNVMTNLIHAKKWWFSYYMGTFAHKHEYGCGMCYQSCKIQNNATTRYLLVSFYVNWQVKQWISVYKMINMELTHWGWVMHICVSKLTIIGTDNGLSPCQRQVIIWANAGIL